jgi:DNA-binding GntR family transcriptional regulator
MPQKRTRVTPIDPTRLRALLSTIGTLLRGIVRDATPLLTVGDKEELREFAARAADAELSELARERYLTEGFNNVFVRRLDNKTIGRLLSRHLPEVRRALIAAPSNASFEKGAPLIAATVEAAAAGDADKAAQGVSDFYEQVLMAVVDDFAAQERKEA